MAFSSWRGTMGLIKPTHRPGSLEETIRLLPEGIGVVPLTVGFSKGDRKEFDNALDAIEARVDELARIGVDLIAPAGAPPFMVHGYRGERQIIDKWEQAHGLPVITAGGSQVDAMRALSARRIVGVTYFKKELNDLFAQYFQDAGFEVLAMDGIDVPFDQVQKLSSHEVYAHTKAAFLRHPEAELVYMMGGGWRILDIVEVLEQDLQVPVLHSVPARVWSTQQHFHVRQRTQGFGRLLSEMPAAVAG
jgi:maleate cis-trans isomerase